MLSTMGLNNLFLASTDLSPSFSETSNQITEMDHKAKIIFTSEIYNTEIDENFIDPSLRLVSVNKPFLYFVREKFTKTVLFAGYYSSPN